jgi:hypothetical protein
LVDPYWFTEAARERGHSVHTIAEAIFQGQPVHVSPAYAGYKTALEQGIGALRFSPVCIERRLQARDLTGRPDAVGYVARQIGSIYPGPAIVDIKSGAPMPAHGIQLSLYEHLADANNLRATLPEWFRDLPWNRIGLYVQETGHYKIHPYLDPNDGFIAQAIVDVTRWRVAHGLLAMDPTAPEDDPIFPEA